MIDFRITRMCKLLETNVNNRHEYYYMFYGKLYNEDKTRFRRFKFVDWFDTTEVREYFNKDLITITDVKMYASFLCKDNCYLSEIEDFYDTRHLEKFFDYCSDSINVYNTNLNKEEIK